MTDPKPCAPKKTMIHYDAECSFCCSCVERWGRNTDSVEFVPAAGMEAVREGIKQDAVILIEDSGESYSGAAAVIGLLRIGGWRFGPMLWRLYERVGLFRWVAERVYAVIARLRRFL